MKKTLTKLWAMTLAVVMMLSAFSINIFATNYNENATNDDYYKLISQKNWQLAPGIEEAEVVINNAQGSRRQVVHSVTVDLSNPYNKVIPGYKGMNEGIQAKKFGTESTSVQALNAEKLGYGNVVAATNAMLSWYNSEYYRQHPEYIGQPLGWNICNGFYYENSQGPLGDMNSSYAVLVVNYDVNPVTGEQRPADMPKVQMRSIADPLTGWEENAISAWAWLIKPDANGNPVKQYGVDHGSNVASRTFMGIKADGTFVVSVSDGDQAPYSTGFTMYEMADYMIKMGCVAACNCDGGGSTTFCTQRPGEDLKVNCSLSDGGERPTTNTILIISDAPADGEFANATITSDYDYYTPGSSVSFNAEGFDMAGTKVDIPSDVEWSVAEDGMGSIGNGVFVSNGNEGTVTVQMKHNGVVVGQKAIHIATPDAISFSQPVVTIPFGKTVNIPIKATTGNGLFTIGLGPNDVTFETDNTALGTFDGLSFTAVDETDAPNNITSNVTATLNMGTNPTASVQLNLGRASQVLYDFEGGQADIDEWMVINNRKNAAHWDYDLNLSLADRTNGMVHDGNYSMRLDTNGLHSRDSSSEQYAWIRLGTVGSAVELENARSIGFWMYVPEDNIQFWLQGHYMFDSDGNGTLDKQADVTMMSSENVYYNVDESGWYYMQMDISQYAKVALKYGDQFDSDPSDGMSGAKGEFWLAIVCHKAINNMLWQTNGSINGPHTYYFDSFTVDYSEAVDDREKPEFGKIYMNGTALVKRDVITTSENTLSFTADVADATERVDATGTPTQLFNTSGIDASTAKASIDGVNVPATYANGKMSVSNITLKDGYHRIRFEITDNAGNNAVIIRVFKVESGSASSTINVVPDDPTLDRIPYGSIYWMNLEATQIETIQSVETIIDLDRVNHWQLDHMILAEGFTSDYSVDPNTNAATITITRTGDNDQTGVATLAKLPVRILNFDDDLKIPGYNAQTYWTSYKFWPQDMKMDVDKGIITFVNNTTSTFSNEEFHVDTETYTNMANMDKTYWSEHGTSHVHTPVVLADKAPTCTQPGYTGRTFCEACNSVVDWGTTIPATGHNYIVSGDRLACSYCDKQITGTGIITVGDKNYYMIAGTLHSGWRLDEAAETAIDTTKYTGVDINLSLVTNTAGWYYFDEETYEGINGKRTFTINGVKVEYTFVDGLVQGVWKSDGTGMKYYYGPDHVKYIKRSQLSNFTWVAINDEIYAFNAKSHRYEDYSVLVNTTGEAILCNFSDDGVLIGKYSPSDNYTGIFKCKNQTTYLKNGVPVNAGLVKDGNDYYYVASGFEAVTGNYDVTRTNGLLLPGFYQFDETGKMINPPVYADGPNSNGYFYKNGVKLTSYQLVEFEGNYYFINDNNKYARDINIYLTSKFVDGTDIAVGSHYFDATGKMVLKNGPYSDGYFYLEGIKQKAYQLIKFEGNYYFINDANKYAKNARLYMSARFVEGTDLTVGYYEFDKDGKLVLKNGPQSDGYFYLNGVRQNAYQLIKFEGNYYFINDAHKYAKNLRLYMSARFVDGTDLAVGYYEFDADGKMVIENINVEDKNGPQDDGYFYLNGTKQKAYQLIKYNGDYYFINDAHKYAKNLRLYMSARFVEGTGLSVGYYDFDETGKMVLKNGPNADGYFYINGVRQNAYQLIEFNGDYYFINDAHKYAISRTIYLTKRFVEPFGLTTGYYEFDATGKAVMKNGPQPDGYFYLNNEKIKSYQIVEFDGNYYFINDGNKYTTGKTLYLTQKFVEPFGMQVGYYEFDETGKIIMKNGPNADGYFYLNGCRQNGVQLVKFEGDYYYIGVDNKYVTSKWQYTQIADKLFYGTDIRPWHLSFDSEGKMIGYYEGIPNGRDLGDIWKLKTTDGKNIKSGLLIRGCELDNSNYYFPTDIIEVGIDRLKNEFQIKFDMDLRSPTATGLDVFDSDVTHKIYDMVLYEQIFTEAGKAKVKEVFTDLANPDNYPIYMHCTHGIDRTGTVSALLEAVLGVERQMIIYEYTLSVGSYGPKIVNVLNKLNSDYAGSTLKVKTENFLKDCGITQAQIDSLREIYLEN